MKKTLVVLTKSAKMKNYCVAGIEVENGKWIRLENRLLDGDALSEQDMTYEDGTVCSELDVIEVECLEQDASNYYQPENVYIDTRYKFRKLNDVTWRDVLNQHPAELSNRLLNCGGGFSYITKEYAQTLNNYAKSLQLIKVRNLHIKESDSKPDSEELSHPKAEFEYENSNGEILKYCLTVTDLNYHPAMKERYIENAYLIVSLGNEFKGNHYLLIAKIVESLDEPFYVTTSRTDGKKYYHKNKDCSLLRYIGVSEKHALGMIKKEEMIKCKRCW